MATKGHMVDETEKSAIVRDADRALTTAYGTERLDEVLNALAHQARVMIGAHQAALSYIPDGNFKAAVHAIALSEKYEKYRTYDVMPTGEGIWAVIAEQKASFCMTQEELARHPRWRNFSGLKDERGLEHPPMRGWLAVPILSGKHHFVGVLQLSDKYEGEFTKQDLELLTHLAKLIAPTFELQNASKELQHLTGELKAQRRAALNLAQDAEDARKRMEQVEERLSLALKSSGVGTWSWNVVENSIIWDDFIHPLFGLKPGAFPGRYEDFLQSLHAEDRERVTQEVARTVEKDAAYDTEYQVVWPDGSVHVLGSRGKVFRDTAGRALRMTGVCWDITERKRFDRALREREEHIRQLLDATAEAIYGINPDGNCTFCNQACLRLLGYHDPSELIGRHMHTFIHHSRPDGTPLPVEECRIYQALQQGVGTHVDDEVLWKSDGSCFPAEYWSYPLVREGHIIGAVVTFLDITERKQAQETVARQAQELLRSNTELEQFAYIASHDLQEPLRKVQSFGDLLVAKSGEALGEEGRDYLKRMQNAANRMQVLVNDLLSFARVTSQAKPFVPVDLGRVVQEVVSDLEVRIKSTGGRVDIGALPRVDGDPLQMRQLLQNLIGNALKFHRPDVPPVVAVESRIVNNGHGAVLQHSPSDRLCEITVQDNGIGFEEKYLDRIFAPFQRLHGRGEYEGTGIGLAICRKIVERHGGTITARSTPGQGTTFIVTLPLRQAKGKTNHA